MFEGFDDAHGRAARGAEQPGRRCGVDRVVGVVANVLGRVDTEQCPGLGEVLGACTVGKETVVTNAVEAVGQDVDEEASDELLSVERHGFVSVFLFGAVVFPAEGDVVFVEGDETGVGDGDAVGVSREVGEDCAGSGEGGTGIDDPLGVAQW